MWGNTPYGDLQQHERGGRTECRREHIRSLDNCFDRSNADATDHLVLSTRANFFYTFGSFYICGSSCYCSSCCCCRIDSSSSWHSNRHQYGSHRTGSAQLLTRSQQQTQVPQKRQHAPQFHTLQVCGSSTIRYWQCYHPSFYHIPHYHSPYALPWVCGSAITPRGLSHPLRGPCELHFYHPGCKIYHTPHRISHPVVFFCKPKMLPPGCGFLCGTR